MFQKLSTCFARHVRSVSTNVSIGVIGVPFESGQRKVGVADGPKVMRQAGLINSIKEIHESIDIKDYGDVCYKVNETMSNAVPNMKKYEHLVGCSKELSHKVTDVIKDGRICLSIGGDHSIAIGTVDGHIRAMSQDVALLWIDAHADINTNLSSDTGNMHGMPVSLLVKELEENWPHLPGMDWLKPILSIRNLAYIGLRSVDGYERMIIEKLGIAAYGMEDVEKYGIHDVVHMALERIDPTNAKSIHVSFDIDSIDPLEAPSTGTPVRGGLTLREGIHIMEYIHKTRRLKAMDLVEVNPSIGTKHDVDLTVSAAVHIITAAFGYSRRGLRPKSDVFALPSTPAKPA